MKLAVILLLFVISCSVLLSAVLFPEYDLIISATVRLLAMGIAIYIAQKVKDWRLLLLAALFLLMATRQILTFLLWSGAIQNSQTLKTVSELPGYLVTILTLITISYLGYMISNKLQIIKRKDVEISELHGLLPICARCKKIRNDEGYWTQIETYISEHSDAEFSHGLCGDCAKEMYGDEKWFKKIENKRK